MNVTKQCKVKILIASKLVDEVDLDVIPLDICGMVLGSSHLYDRKEIFFHHEKMQNHKRWGRIYSKGSSN